MNRKALVLVLAALATASLVTGCSGSPEGAATQAAPRVFAAPLVGETVLTVNGEAITAALLDAFARGRGLDVSVPEQRKQALDLLTESLLVAQDAIGTGMHTRDDVEAALDLARMQVLAARHLSETRAQLALGEAELRAYYDEVTARTGDTEYHLRSILHADPAAAQAATEKALVPGADFTAVVAEAEKSGALQARDLGWLNVGQLPEELAEAVKALKDGEVTAAPVQTRFGWHVVQRVESRPFVAPPFEQVQERLRKQAGDRALEQKLEALREKAVIVVPEAAVKK